MSGAADWRKRLVVVGAGAVAALAAAAFFLILFRWFIAGAFGNL